MEKFILYHNPRCSKSREALALLEAAGIKPVIIEYLKTPPSEADLLSLMKTIPPASLVRAKEESFREKPFALEEKSAVAKELSRRPELLERPILVRGDRAVIGRPPEKVKELF
jgi:arsenate reductase